jgi:hypothetical protein
MSAISKPTRIRRVDSLPNSNGPGTPPISEESHKMVQGDRNVDPHHRSGDRNVDDKKGKTASH